MTHLLNIVKQQARIDEKKLRILCLQHNIWDHFGIFREEFCTFPEAKQLQLLKKFYFDLAPSIVTSAMNPTTSSRIDLSIGSAIQNSSSIKMTKVIENGTDRSELTVSAQNEEVVNKSINLWPNFRYFATESCDFAIEKANLPENTIFYVNQGYQSSKDGKKVYYTDVFIIA